MGTGKSSVGRLLARRARREFVDIDRFLEDQEKRKIRDIFEKDGESHFRALEKKAVKHWSEGQGRVITTGGGAVMDADNLAALKKNGIIITLLAKPETIYERVKNSKSRPLLKEKKDLFAEICRLLELRKPFYAQADYFFDTDGKNASQVVKLIEHVLAQKGEL